MKAFTLILLFIAIGCGKSGSNTPPPSCDASNPTKALCGVDGVQFAVYTQETGFTDVQLCSVDIHMIGTQVYVTGGNPSSQTDNSQYVQAPINENYWFPTGYQGSWCYFSIVNGKLQ